MAMGEGKSSWCSIVCLSLLLGFIWIGTSFAQDGGNVTTPETPPAQLLAPSDAALALNESQIREQSVVPLRSMEPPHLGGSSSTAQLMPEGRMPYVSTEVVRIDCGSMTGNSTIPGVGWFGPDNDWHIIRDGAYVKEFDTAPDGYQSLLNSARVWRKPASYELRIETPGAYWLRLYFRGFKANNSRDHSTDITNATFSVAAGQSLSPGAGAYTLLSDVSVNFEQLRQKKSYIYYEYFLNIQTHKLFVTFIPAPNSSYAFVNGLELLSAPQDLYGHQGLIPHTGETKNSYVPINLAATALETKFRLNVGGDFINRSSDSELSREWDAETRYLTGESVQTEDHIHDPLIRASSMPSGAAGYFAPKEIYSSARLTYPNQNNTWTFNVESGFTYLVRLHFCEIQLAKIGERIFDVFLNEHASYLDLDIVAAASGRKLPLAIDFEVTPNDKNQIVLQVGNRRIVPTHSSSFSRDGLLNGVEILKMHDLNLASFVVDTAPPPPPSSNSAVGRSIAAAILVLPLTLGITILANL